MRRTPMAQDEQNKSQKREFVIAQPTLFSNLDVRELIAYRGLVVSLFRRRVRAEFDRQHLAFLWVIARPALLVLCFSMFKRLSSAETGGAVPYPLFVYSGIVFWYFFADAVMETASSIRNDAAIIQKVYFPRLISPVVALLANSYLLAIGLVPVIGLMVYYGIFPSVRLLLLPAIFAQLCLLVFGLGCLFAAISITSRDWERFLGFALYIGLFLSPVFYSLEMIPYDLRLFYAVNPMVGTLEALRSSLLMDVPWPAGAWAYSVGFSAAICAFGLAAFKTAEKFFVDKL
jgi:lipopolysaccharide transport system permease protein